MGSKCFQNLSNLRDLEIIAASVFIGENCFDNCSSLKNVTISNLMKFNNGFCPFNKCIKIENVTLMYLANANLVMTKNPFSKSSIQNFEIKDDGSETLTVTLDDGCFEKCISIHKFKISSSKKVSFGLNVFKKSKNLTQIEINAKSEIRFSKNCFSNSKVLQNAIFHTDDLVIGESCFVKCDKLKLITTSPNTVLTSGKGRMFKHRASEDNDQSCVYDLI